MCKSSKDFRRSSWTDHFLPPLIGRERWGAKKFWRPDRWGGILYSLRDLEPIFINPDGVRFDNCLGGSAFVEKVANSGWTFVWRIDLAVVRDIWESIAVSVL